MNDIDKIFNQVVPLLANTAGVQAVVLGGSRARGTHTKDSDLDIGIYYDPETLDLPALQSAAKQADDLHREPLIAAPGEWGNWVNGGGWLTINGYPVDFILRDITRVKDAIADGQAGIATAHYQTGHPHAYLNVMYMGELAISQILWDRDGEVSALQTAAKNYPAKLKAALIQFFSFESEFSLMFAQNNLTKEDNYYVVAHLVRSVSALNQVLFAANEEYCLNEKKAVNMIDGFPLHPVAYQERIDTIFGIIGSDTARACSQMQLLLEETKTLVS